MLDRKDILKRLRKWMAEGKRAEGKIQPLSAIRLLHLNAESGERPIESWDIDHETQPEELVNDLVSTSDNDSDGHKGDGTQRYAFIAHFGESGAWTASYKFSIYKAPDMGEEGAEMGSDAGTQKGMLVSAHRHIEQLIKVAVQSADMQITKLIRQVEQRDNRIKELESERDSVWEAQQELMDRTHQRAIEDRKQAFWEQQKENIAGLLLPMIPIVLAALTKKDIKGEISPEMLALKEFFKTLKPEQLDALFGDPQTGQQGIFDPRQAMVMRIAIQQAIDMEDKKEADVQQRMIDPQAHAKMKRSLFDEDDVAGGVGTSEPANEQAEAGE